MKPSVFLIGTILAIASSVCAQEEPGKSTPQVQFDQLRAEGYKALYNLDYQGARRNFTEMTKLLPSHPAGAQCLAATIWIQQLNQSWRLKASLYNNDAYAGSKEKVDRKVVEEFREATRRAKALSEARLREQPGNLEALYFLGATEGLESAFAAGIEHRFMAALRSGSRSVDRHREVLKRAPDYRDAELTIGLYNYIVGSLPLTVKFLAGTMGVRGSKKRGLESLERVASEGHWARDVARVLLVDLYKREKRWQDAANVANELSSRYPRNYFFKLQVADALSTALANKTEKQPTQSSVDSEQRVLRIFEELLHDRAIAVEKGTVDIIRFRYGEALLAAGHIERAMNEFFWVTKNSSEKELTTMSRLRAAQTLDLMGRRSEALAGYRAVLSAVDINNSQEHARRGLREPFKIK